jgi:hypothetical protein
MLVQLMPNQIQINWPLIRGAIVQAEGESKDPFYYAHILDGLCAGQAQAWVLYDCEQEEMLGICVTQIITNDFDKTNQLLIHSIAGLAAVEPMHYRMCYDTLRAYAQHHHCIKIVAYTEHPGITKLAVNLGAKTKTYIELEV